jgi:Flp pilus assembly protein TadG
MKRKRLPNEKGQALIFVTLAFVILGMFIGLAVDGGRAYLMRERLRSIVDAAALAGAKALAGPTDLGAAEEAAREAACDSAKVNGLDAGACDGARLNVVIGPIKDGTLGVTVTGTDASRTFFMALGGFIGCDSCTTINVQHVGVAVPDTLVDLVLVLDDSGTMSTLSTGTPCVTFTEPDCPINGAKQGAMRLVTMLLADPTSHAKIAFVPFRGCYAGGRNLPPDLPPDPTGRLGCIITNTEIQDLTNDSTALANKINTRFGAGGFPGTNVCLGMHEGRNRLFGSEGRGIARKVMVVLTDGDQTYSDHAWGGNPNLANPVPTPYPTRPYIVGSGDGGTDATPGSCMSPSPAGDASSQLPNSQYDSAINSLDGLANAKANILKKGDPSGATVSCSMVPGPSLTPCVEIYVLRFASPSGDDPATTECNPALVGDSSGSGRDYSNDSRDRNLSRCLASNRVNGDPFADPDLSNPNDHYFYAATVADINTKFAVIANNILKKRRLVS